MSDALFNADEYGEDSTRQRRARTEAAVVEALVEPWVLIADRLGVKGFHIPKNIDKFSTCVTVCGLQGRVVTPPPSQMVRCHECGLTALT